MTIGRKRAPRRHTRRTTAGDNHPVDSAAAPTTDLLNDAPVLEATSPEGAESETPENAVPFISEQPVPDDSVEAELDDAGPTPVDSELTAPFSESLTPSESLSLKEEASTGTIHEPSSLDNDLSGASFEGLSPDLLPEESSIPKGERPDELILGVSAGDDTPESLDDPTGAPSRWEPWSVRIKRIMAGADAAKMSPEPQNIPALLQIPESQVESKTPEAEESVAPERERAQFRAPERAAAGSNDGAPSAEAIQTHRVSPIPEAPRAPVTARSNGETGPSESEQGPPAILGFQFRVKPAEAPTPEEAAAQTDWAPSRAARIGRRGELPRTGRGATLRGRAGDLIGPDDEDTGTLESLPEGPDGLTFEPSESLVDEIGALPDTFEEPETAEERAGRSRRRKDRSKGRRRDRNGAGAAPLDESAVEEQEEVAPASTDGRRTIEAEATTGPRIPEFRDEEQAAEAEALSKIGLDQRLGKEIFVNTGARETRIAFLVAGSLTELHIEREERLVGAIGKARVERVLQGLDAAFVDIGLERNAFLMAADVTPEDDDDDSSHGRRHRHASIGDLVKPRQEIMVQVSKAPRSSKGARVSTRISLPGRYLVLMPDGETVGVSRKIDEDSERDRLKKVARQIRPQGFGIIVRTEAEDKTEEELRNDVEFLLRLWKQIQQKYKSARHASIVHRDLSLTFKIIRDLFGSDVNRFVIDSREEYEKVIELVELISPRMRPRVILYEDPVPIFEYLGIEAEIERLFRNKIWLKSGGWLAIDETEALTTIDVNSGKNVGTTNPAQTIFRVNIEAVAEICRQLRLRDIGGMIILDFIDMSNAKDRAAVMKALDVNLRKDRSRTKIAHLSPLGLVEMTRKRSGETFSELTTEPCSYCGGRGRTMNADTVSILAEREIIKQALDLDDEAFLIMVHPSVAPFLIGPEGANVDRLEREIRRAVYVRVAENLHIEKFEVAPADLQEVERQLLPYREGQVVDCVVEQTPAINLPHAIARLDGYLLDLVNGGQYLGRRVRAKLVRVGRSIAMAEVVGGGRPVDKLGGA